MFQTDLFIGALLVFLIIVVAWALMQKRRQDALNVRDMRVEQRHERQGDLRSLTNDAFVIGHPLSPALAVRSAGSDNLEQIARALDLSAARPTLFILGGAMAMESDEMMATRGVIEDGLAVYAQANRIAIIDGGTHSGVMQLMGEARIKHGASFALIGVAPVNLVKYPGYDNPSGYDLDPGHSHFVLTRPGDWGDETETILQLAYTLAGDRPLVGMIINGGGIVRQEVYQIAVVNQLNVTLLVLEGSGRFADALAAAYRAGTTEDDDLRAIIAHGRLELIRLADGPDHLRARLAHHLGG